jgi:hypothetical protein
VNYIRKKWGVKRFFVYFFNANWDKQTMDLKNINRGFKKLRVWQIDPKNLDPNPDIRF